MPPPCWLSIERSDSPLILAFPHGGSDVPPEMEARLASGWLARKDADWRIAELYAGLADATRIKTSVSRSVIDVNRDPSGASLYPGQATTGLCPLTTFDGEPLYQEGEEPGETEIVDRRQTWFDPYHEALAAEIARLRRIHNCVVLYDCHSIRSRIPRLFTGDLPEMNIGSNGGASASPALTAIIEKECAASGRSYIVNGRFRGGWTTRHYGRPESGVHAVQMELSCRAYLDEPLDGVCEENWPAPFEPARAEPLRRTLATILAAAINFARKA